MFMGKCRGADICRCALVTGINLVPIYLRSGITLELSNISTLGNFLSGEVGHIQVERLLNAAKEKGRRAYRMQLVFPDGHGLGGAGSR